MIKVERTDVATGPILAVIDREAHDADVVAEAVWLARAAQTSVLLVHVAQPSHRADSTLRQAGLELRVLGELDELAAQVREAGLEAHVDDVYFGETSAEVAYAASRRRASVVVAARRPGRFSKLLAGRSRDVRLGRLLRVPLVLIDPVPTRPVVGDFDWQPSLTRPAHREPETTQDLRQRAA